MHTSQYLNDEEIDKLNELKIRTLALSELLKAYISEDGKITQSDASYLATTILPLVTDSLDFVCAGMNDVSDSLALNQWEASNDHN